MNVAPVRSPGSRAPSAPPSKHTPAARESASEHAFSRQLSFHVGAGDAVVLAKVPASACPPTRQTRSYTRAPTPPTPTCTFARRLDLRALFAQLPPRGSDLQHRLQLRVVTFPAVMMRLHDHVLPLQDAVHILAHRVRTYRGRPVQHGRILEEVHRAMPASRIGWVSRPLA